MAVEEVINKFHLLMDRSRSKAQYAYLRSVIKSEEEANNFVDLFAEKTNTIWIPQTGKQVSARYTFYLTWFCNRSWRKRDTSQGDDCNAKIDIYMRKPEPSSARYDEYLHYDPPLPCVIEIAGQHSHPLESLDYKIIKGVKDKVKREFFKYFQMGLSPTEAKSRYSTYNKHKRATRSKQTPTLRQAQRLYNQWKGVKRWASTEKDELQECQLKPVTFKEILNSVPKREILYSVKHLQSEMESTLKSDASDSKKNIKFPLVFVSVGSVAATPSTTAPLLYKLKHGIAGELVSDLVKPRIYSICIDSASPVVKNQMTGSTQELPNSSEPESDEILGIPVAVDEPVEEFQPTEAMNISIKMEPLNDGYEDEPSPEFTVKVEDNPAMPIITDSFSFEDPPTEEIDIKPNIADSMKDQTTVKANICPTKAGNSFFPLVFTLKGSIYEASNSRSLVYVLKQGSTGVQATEIVIPQISSVQINSLNEAAFQFKDASMLKAEGPLSVSVQTEYFEEHINTTSSNGNLSEKKHEKDIIPVIIKASSCSDLFPVITNSINTSSKRPHEDRVISSVEAPTNVVIHKTVLKKRKTIDMTQTEKVTVTEVDTNDEDYLFLMSLLPELKRVPPDEKKNVKGRMKDIFVTSRITTNRYQFEKKSTNIYRDCGVLPTLGGWKF